MADPFLVNKLVLEEAYIEWDMKNLIYNRSVGPSCMRAENLCLWLSEVRNEENLDTTHSLKVVNSLKWNSFTGGFPRKHRGKLFPTAQIGKIFLRN